MKPRITINSSETGDLEIWLNEAGRDLLVKKLQNLTEQSDHFHLGPEYLNGDVPVQVIPYRDDDKIIERGKVLFRPDHWDRKYFPHVLIPDGDRDGSS
ncbi:MAG: hypothetical protein HEQ22_15245 [Sphingopyxis sp.]|uniref:hypothetical protein n=1 Tax=Sphingopyxis sp. TaxID=1908224 RepID=UPI003D80DD78